MYPFIFLPKIVARELFSQLCRQLPPPENATPESRDARDMTAMAAIAAIAPIDANEALLAIRVVAADAHARESLRLAVLHHADLLTMARCQAQAALMMRQSQQAQRLLERVQMMRPAGQTSGEAAENGEGQAESAPGMRGEEAGAMTPQVDPTRPPPGPRRPVPAGSVVNNPMDKPWTPPPNNLPKFAELWLRPAHETRHQKRYEPPK